MRLKTAALAVLLTASTLAISSKAGAQSRDYAYPVPSEQKTEKAFHPVAKAASAHRPAPSPPKTKHYRHLYPLAEQNFSASATFCLSGKRLPGAYAMLESKSILPRNKNLAVHMGAMLGTTFSQLHASGLIEDDREPNGQGLVASRYTLFRAYDIITPIQLELGSLWLPFKGRPAVSFLAGGAFIITYEFGKERDSTIYYWSDKNASRYCNEVSFSSVEISLGLMAGAKLQLAEHFAITAFYMYKWIVGFDGPPVDYKVSGGTFGITVSYPFYFKKGSGYSCPRY